ncbi:glycosylphosphatidylinositol anchor attachment 1 protein isoform X2 [Macadamia integrifolia]|uniref:glycosylphosphatidylinositol anchor attachment 1 protein isoform X2 n=1 Tax=Macadamia integrifolia TaxID=60698 RepID=UPI001C4F2673|nr:glycosylphosphatidylinositol anchor attachment 1 protein isoform X2 [Macadamia integrifolia]
MAEGNKGTQTPKMKPRPIVRIGIFLISHSFFVCVVCCTAGIVALLLLPVLAKSTYISENALMPGSANPMLSVQEVAEADRLVKDMIGLKEKSGEAGKETPRLIAQHMADLGVEFYHHKFHPQTNHFHPLDPFSGKSYSGKITENSSCAVYGINTVGIIRAPRGDGKEAIVLVTPYNPVKLELNEALSVALAYSIISFLTQVTWLAKDIVWLAADSRYGEYASVAAWLRDYHTPAFSDALGKLDAGMCPETNTLLEQNVNAASKGRVKDDFSRAGTMAAALVFKVVNRHKETEKDALTIFAEASNGQMPNLDLINIVNYLAVHRQGLHVKVEKVYSLLNSMWLKVVGDILHLVDKVARSINPQWKFAIPLEDYIEGAATLASSMYHQALGLPTGSHGAFRDYQVDAVTLEISSKVSLLNKSARYEFLLRIGRLVEGIIRSVNNLLEKFHQSFFLYFLTSPVAAALYSGANGRDYSSSDKSNSASTNGLSTALKSWKWLHAAKVVFIVHLWGAIVSLLPYLICRLHGMTPTTSMLSWVSLSICTLLVLYQISGSPYSCSSLPQSQHRQWAIMKAVMIAAASIGLVIMSIINFATAQIGALLMVPMCLMAHPLKYVHRLGRLRALTLIACNLFLGFFGFPPTALLVMRIWSEGINGVSVGDFWIWVESLWAWNSATYLYLGLVHLPCWLLCVHILFHPC